MTVMKQYEDVDSGINQISGRLVHCFFEVHKELGPGYAESVYEEALELELSSSGLEFQRQKTFQVFYKGKILPSTFRPDLIVENKIIVELKAIEKLVSVHQAQVYSYLKATRLPVGFLVNFNVPLIKDGMHRFVNKYSGSPDLRVKKEVV